MTSYYAKPINSYLRDPPKHGVRRSAYEVETNPWSRRGDVEAALLFRGTIVSAYGYIESRMAELAIRISRMPEYDGLRASFPFAMDKRVSYLRRAFARAPLSSVQATAELALSRFESASEMRHQVAHARMHVQPDWGVVFEDYKRGDDGQLTHRTGRYLLDDLERAAWRAAWQSRLCQRLLDDLDRSELLPPIA